MRTSSLVCTVALVGAVLAAGALARVDAAPAPAPEAHVSTWRDYAGSESCRACHRAIYDQWRKSGHARAMVPPSSDTVLGAFDGQRFESFGQWYRPYRDGNRYMMDVPDRDGTRRQQQVYFVLGYRQVQMYLTQYDGQLQMLPIGWAVGDHRWTNSMEDLNEFRKVGPEHRNFWTNQGRTWNRNCEICHHGVPTLAAASGSGAPVMTIEHGAVGCEQCHGPGKKHIAFWRDMKPVRAGLRDDTIVNPARFGRDVAVSACANCHTEYIHYFTDFNAGDDFFQSFRIHLFDDDDVFWPDGRPRRHSTRLQGLMQSLCYQQSDMSCTTCHAAHGSDQPRELKAPPDSDAPCIQCHAEEAVRISAHTRHEPDSPGSRCVNCHMPRMEINYPNADRMRMHTMDVPLPELSRDYGVPNACNVCHTDRDVEWAIRWRDRWWGPSDHWRLRWARVISAARDRDGAVIPDLEAMLGDPDELPIMRATAARFLGLGHAGMAVPALIAAVDDPDPTVRISAVDSLGRITDHQAVPALRKALHDDNRIVRAEAAYALGRLRSIPRIGPDGEAYDAAAALFERYLRGHDELADIRLKWGNLYFDQGHFEEAVREYQRAIAVNDRPGSIKLIEPGTPYENIGSVRWQQRRFGEALDLFAKAVRVQPDLGTARRKYAEALRALGRREEAAAEYETLIAEAPQDYTSRLKLAELYLDLRRPADALEQVNAVLAVAPDQPTARRLQLQAQRALGDT